MVISIKRQTLHKVIDNLSEKQLLELAQFIEFLLAREHQVISRFNLLEATDNTITPDNSEYDLDKLLDEIKNTPPDTDAIAYATKTWTELDFSTIQTEDETLDIAKWNNIWDTIETNMRSSSLSHEEYERQEQWP